MKRLFQKTSVELPKGTIHKGKRQLLLHSIGSDWCMNIVNEKLPPQNKTKLIKKAQER